MSKMMAQLHRIREAHHERVKSASLDEPSRGGFPSRCEHCGERSPAITQRANSPAPTDNWTILEILKLENGRARARVQSPLCPNCHKRTFTEIEV
ncbi:MAG: hypothetical protein HY706_11250 [Candidatus Hydrogenedentes bacterium]|nr:hypothetical protein [Candidatus Hydrogenedentota bacterium]